MSAQHTPEPWYADWDGTMSEVRAVIASRAEAARHRKLASRYVNPSAERRIHMRDAANAQRRANNAAECVRYCAGAIEAEARLAKATGSAS